MSLLWVEAAHTDWDPDESHDWHRLHPAFEAAGIKPSPCNYTDCDQHDGEHSDAFDRADDINYENHQAGRKAPVEHVDPKKDPIHGFESSGHPSLIRKYLKDPQSRSAGLPVAFRHQGNLHLIDGHHGTAAALHRGDARIPMHVIDLDHQPGQET